jgi:hypothetical protein
MTAADDLPPIAKHALWVSCMASNVPVEVADATTVERVAALVRADNGTWPPGGSQAPSLLSVRRSPVSGGGETGGAT